MSTPFFVDFSKVTQTSTLGVDKYTHEYYNIGVAVLGRVFVILCGNIIIVLIRVLVNISDQKRGENFELQ